MIRALVVCVGNSLVSDDGVAAAVHDALVAEKLPESVRLRQLNVAGLELLELFDGDDLLLIVDAEQSGDVPGTIKLSEASNVFSVHAATSAHDVGVAEALAIGRLLQPTKMPRRAAVITVVGSCFDQFRQALSPAVAVAVQEVVSLTLTLIADLGVIDAVPVA